MEEIRNISYAYHANLSDDQKVLSKENFKSVWDKNGDGKVTYEQYVRLLCKLEDPRLIHPRFFNDLDRDGDGFLDYADIVTLWYLLRSGRLQFCYGCGAYLKGAYFTCVQCFSSNRSNCNVCVSCFRSRNFQHHQDAIFCDNYGLLLKCGWQPGDPAVSSSTTSKGKEKINGADAAVGAVKIAVGLANFLASVI